MDEQTAPNKPHRTLGLQFIIMMLLVAILSSACASDSTTTTAATEITAPVPTVSEADPTPVPTATPEPVLAPDPTPAAAEPAGASTPSLDVADTPAGETLEWVVTLMNSPGADADEVAAKFDPEFLALIPIEQIMGSFPQFWSAEEPWVLRSAEVDEFTASAVIASGREAALDAQLTVDAEEPHLIQGIRFAPAVEVEQVSSIEEYEQALSAFAPISQVGVFEILDGECAVVIDVGAETVMPIGSVFKLWVLAELAHQVQSGQASWDETMTVQDNLKSSPDGTIFEMAAGDEVTLRMLAEQMIAISDNSATDHLMFRLGRLQIEQAMVDIGVSQSERNIPMLSTSDLFRIKFDPTPPNSADYRALDLSGRRSMLDDMVATDVSWLNSEPPMANADGVSIADPRDHDLEWFATPLDICRTHAYLAELALLPGLEPIAEILSVNPTAGMTFEPADWTDLRYKGGSEQGLAAVAWWMERSDGRIFVLAGGVENPDQAIDPALAVATLHQAVALTAEIS